MSSARETRVLSVQEAQEICDEAMESLRDNSQHDISVTAKQTEKQPAVFLRYHVRCNNESATTADDPLKLLAELRDWLRHTGYQQLLTVDEVEIEYLRQSSYFAEAVLAVRRVILEGCDMLRDLSPLRGSKEVIIISCARVTEVDDLSTAMFVQLQKLPLVTDVGCLRHVEILALLQMHGVHSVSGLQGGSLCAVLLADMPQISCLAGLASAKTVQLENMPGLSSLVGIGDAHTVHLNDMPAVRSLKPLRWVQTVYASNLFGGRCYTREPATRKQPDRVCKRAKH